MTERDWHTCADPSRLLDHLKGIGPLKVRKLRLFALSCARRVEHLLTEGDEIGRRALAAAEEMSEGRADPAAVAGLQEQLRSQAALADGARHNALDAVYNALQDGGGPDYSRPSREGYPRLGGDWLYEPPDLMEAVGAATRAVYQASGDPGDWLTSEAVKAEGGQQAAALHDIFGNPFRPVPVEPAWLTSDVAALAEGIYRERAFDRLPILADALQDAGCDNADVLDHCRGPGPHVRGCWVVDLVLGKG